LDMPDFFDTREAVPCLETFPRNLPLHNRNYNGYKTKKEGNSSLKLFHLCDTGKIQFELFWAEVMDLINSRSDMCLLYHPDLWSHLRKMAGPILIKKAIKIDRNRFFEYVGFQQGTRRAILTRKR
jgi:hypothetical protein